jgi:regulator of protease activity HflC (stomatin/prohibitin superfamily)
MTNWIKDLFDYLAKVLQWWVIVNPWEEGIRVRLGRRVRRLRAGTYLKLPIIDQVFIQTTRLRVRSLPLQTLTTKDGNTISLLASIGYSINDVDKLYRTLYQPEGTLINICMSSVADYVASNNLSDCSPKTIQDNINVSGVDQYGLDNVTVKVIGYAVVRTYRLLMDGHWQDNGANL